jgi:thiosulfate dehydrogenase [quinone] large subunit
MLFAFVESIKYVGHLWPVAFLRIFLGWYYLQQAILKFNGDFLIRPRLASQIAETLPLLQVSPIYRDFLENIFIPHWQTFAFIIVALEFAIALSYILGFVVRPMALTAAILALNMMMMTADSGQDFFKLIFVCHITLSWVGAGRCLGVDYYFFKRKRGIWW